MSATSFKKEIEMDKEKREIEETKEIGEEELEYNFEVGV